MIQRWGHRGPEILCLHCSLARGRAWAGVAKHLKSAQLVAPDLPGHGAAPDLDPDRDFHDQTTDAVRALLPPGASPVIGHSFGATIALRLAIEMPGRIAALVLYEPVLFAAAGEGPGRRATAAADGPIEPLLSQGRRDLALDKFLSVWGAAGSDALRPDLRRYMEERVHLVEAASPALNADTARLVPRLSEIGIPVLLMEGEESPSVIAEIMAALAADLPDARRVRIPGAGHMGPVTHPAEVAAEIGVFLRELKMLGV